MKKIFSFIKDNYVDIFSLAIYILPLVWFGCAFYTIKEAHINLISKIISFCGFIIIVLMWLGYMLSSDDRTNKKKKLKYLENKKILYEQCFNAPYDMCDFLSSAIDTSFKAEFKKCVATIYEYSQMMFRMHGEIISMVSLENFRDRIRNDWNNFEGKYVEIYGFIYPYASNVLNFFPQTCSQESFSYVLRNKHRFTDSVLRKLDSKVTISNSYIRFNETPRADNVVISIDEHYFVKICGYLAKEDNKIILNNCITHKASFIQYIGDIDSKLDDVLMKKIETSNNNTPESQQKMIDKFLELEGSQYA